MKYRPPVSLRRVVHRPRRVGRAHARREEAAVLQLLLRRSRIAARRPCTSSGSRSSEPPRRVLSSKVCVKSSVTWYFVSLSPFANRRLAPLPAVHWNPCPLPTGTPAERAAVRHEDAVQIPELPVPRRRPGGEHERQGDAAGARAAGPCLRVNHAALVRAKSASDGSARRVDDVCELLRHVP